jgi:hypothetical protein
MSVGCWYISFVNARTQFFHEEELLTEAEWRARAPVEQVKSSTPSNNARLIQAEARTTGWNHH